MGRKVLPLLPESVPEHVAERLIGLDWAQLEVVEHAGYLLFPDKIYKAQKSGKFKSEDVMLRVPRWNEQRQARVKARELAAREGIDEEKDRDLFENLENMCIMAVAIRSPTEPYEPFISDVQGGALALEKTYDGPGLTQIWEKIDKLNDLINPAPEAITKAEMVALLAAISEARNILPLVAYAPGAQAFFIVTMADLLMSYLDPKSSSESSALSTAAS
jgi:hypothetical protein